MATVFQPSSIIGNGYSLVTLGKNGEIMSFFYPRLDHAQNIKQGMVALFTDNSLHWTYDTEFENTQEYIKDTNILTTTCKAHGIELKIVDFMTENEPVFIRRFVIKNISDVKREGKILQYVNIDADDIKEKNSARYYRDERLITQSRRDTSFAVLGSDNLSGASLGKSDTENSAFNTMKNGQLNNQNLEIGNIDMAFAFDYSLMPCGEKESFLYFSAANNEKQAVEQAVRAKNTQYDELLSKAKEWAAAYLDDILLITVKDELMNEVFNRSILALSLICDKKSGGFLAAPEFDPDFLQSGGYGFMWPRDAAEVILPLNKINLGSVGEKFFEFAEKLQNEDGYFEQRYWLNGEKGPCWCDYPEWLQIDQVAAIPAALYEWSNEPDERFFAMMEKSTDFLLNFRDKNGLHKNAADCWEKFRGTFCYSNAVIYRAFLSAAKWHEKLNNTKKAKELSEAAKTIKKVILNSLYNGEYFARGIDENDNIDWQADAAMFGLFDPFFMLELEADDERQMIENMVKSAEERLIKQLPEGNSIIRHEFDDYADGSSGGVTTLWLSRILLRLAIYYKNRNCELAKKYKDKAVNYIKVVIHRSTVTHLLPELIGGGNIDYWAAAHGWAMASYIQCMLLLSEYENDSSLTSCNES